MSLFSCLTQKRENWGIFHLITFERLGVGLCCFNSETFENDSQYHCVVSIPKHSKMIVNKSMLTFQITSRLQFDFFCLVLKQITIKNALFCKTSLFNQGYYIEVISKTFSSHLTLTRFLIFLQPLKIVVWVFFFCLIKK